MTWLTAFDGAAINLVAKVAPWLAPFPTAWLVYDRTQQHLDWPWWVAVIAGLTLEALGVAILATALEHYTYNRERRKTDPAAPLWVSIVLILLYFIAAELLTVLLDVVPVWVGPLAPAVFPVLSVAAMAVLAIRADHKRRLTEIEQGKAEAKAARQQRKQEREQRQIKPMETLSESEPELPFMCLVCGAGFVTQAALNGHGNKHRTDNGRKPKEAEREREQARANRTGDN